MSTPADEAGTGLIATVAAVLVFLALVSFAAQLLVALYARTVVSSIAFDAARSVATGTGPTGDAGRVEVPGAERTARRLLGRTGAGASFTWEVSPDVVQLRVRTPVPRLSILPLAGLMEVDRTVTVRSERVR